VTPFGNQEIKNAGSLSGRVSPTASTNLGEIKLFINNDRYKATQPFVFSILDAASLRLETAVTAFSTTDM
jgi:hypothetical protein